MIGELEFLPRTSHAFSLAPRLTRPCLPTPLLFHVSGEALPADSRTFGPVDARHHVFGRVVYSIRSAADHSPVRNPSRRSRAMDGAMALALDDHEIIQKFLDAYK